MELTNAPTEMSSAPTLPDQSTIKLQVYLDDRGIKYSWLAAKLGVDRSWFTLLFAGKTKLPQIRKEQIEQLLAIKL